MGGIAMHGRPVPSRVAMHDLHDHFATTYHFATTPLQRPGGQAIPDRMVCLERRGAHSPVGASRVPFCVVETRRTKYAAESACLASASARTAMTLKIISSSADGMCR